MPRARSTTTTTQPNGYKLRPGAQHFFLHPAQAPPPSERTASFARLSYGSTLTLTEHAGNEPSPDWTPEAHLCIRVVDMAIHDLENLPTQDHHYQSARAFFLSPNSNWWWMRAAFQQLDPDHIQHHAESIIQAREAGPQPCRLTG